MDAIHQFPLLLAQVSHGPGMHGGLIGILVAVAVIGGLVYAVRLRSRADRDADADRGAEPDAERRPGPEA